ANLRKPRTHPATRLTRLNATIPGRRGVGELPERFGNLARRLAAHLMATGAAVGVDDVADPFTLTLDVGRDAVAAGPRPGQIAGGGHLQKREPVRCRVVLGRHSWTGRGHSLQREGLAGTCLHFLR